MEWVRIWRSYVSGLTPPTRVEPEKVVSSDGDEDEDDVDGAREEECEARKWILVRSLLKTTLQLLRDSCQMTRPAK